LSKQHTPFEDVPLRREDVVMKNVLRHNFVPPPTISPAAQDLITKLLHPEPSARLGCQSAGSIDVQDHKWFAGDPQSYTQLAEPVDFVGISGCTAPPPFVPVLMHKADHSHFPDAKAAT
jgi:serine/threonine protein kinase